MEKWIVSARATGLKPHLLRGFKVSRDPLFVEKLEEIAGLYMSSPEHAWVLCCDEKSQVQALDRTQPGLPLKKGRSREANTRSTRQSSFNADTPFWADRRGGQKD